MDERMQVGLANVDEKGLPCSWAPPAYAGPPTCGQVRQQHADCFQGRGSCERRVILPERDVLGDVPAAS
eukprot:13953533-Alexandrium_andersonii.AAC.1